MIYWLIGGGILVYVIGSYVLVAHWLDKHGAGPGGLGWLAWFASPVIIPMIGLGMVKGWIHRATR